MLAVMRPSVSRALLSRGVLSRGVLSGVVIVSVGLGTAVSPVYHAEEWLYLAAIAAVTQWLSALDAT